jgi:hypothetical protein
LHGARGGGEDFGVGSFAGARAHNGRPAYLNGHSFST